MTHTITGQIDISNKSDLCNISNYYNKFVLDDFHDLPQVEIKLNENIQSNSNFFEIKSNNIGRFKTREDRNTNNINNIEGSDESSLNSKQSRILGELNRMNYKYHS